MPGHFASKLTQEGGSVRPPAAPASISNWASVALTCATVRVAQDGVVEPALASALERSFKHVSRSPTVAVQVLPGGVQFCVPASTVVIVEVHSAAAAAHAACAAALVVEPAAASTSSVPQVALARAVLNAPLSM